MPAPICLFVYNRPQETSRLLQSLSSCAEAPDSELYVFSDGAKTDKDKACVDAVRKLFLHLDGFKRVIVKEQEHNQGLANSVINGVTELLTHNDSVIVLEDDLEVSSDFLSFMNEALTTYRGRKDIWSISGYTPQIDIPSDYHSDIFLVQRPQCWGWATWRDRWQLVDWRVSQSKILRDRNCRNDFNQGGNDLSRTLAIWQKGRIDAWAIRWVFAAWLHHTWTVNPVCSKVKNSGFADNATHAGWHDQRHAVELNNTPVQCDIGVQPDARICQSFKQHHDLGPISRIGYFLRLHNLGYKQLKRLLKRQ